MADKVDPNFTPVKEYSAQTLATAKANAAPGQTAEQYLASRGGVNAAGYYGDSWNAKTNLTDTEYASTLAEARAAGQKGVGLGNAINVASARKRYESALASGMDPAQAQADFDAALAGTAGMLKQFGYTGPSTNSSIITSNAVGNITGAPTTNVEVLKAALRGLGFKAAIVDSSTSFLSGLLKDGLDYDNATEIFLNSKEYTLKNGSKITSPFYTEYGYLNDGLTVPKTAKELFNTVEGYKGVVDKYKLSSKYLSQDNLKLYVKNDVTVADLSERAAAAQLRAIEADPFQIKALMAQGYIASAADLTDFYLDPKIGQEQLELNRQTGVFTAEALRRAKSGISASAEQLSGFKQLTATLAAKGYSEAQIAQLAGTGFENIAQSLEPTTQLAQIYEKAGGTVESNAALKENIQSSLLQEEFMGTASERRKRLSEQNVRAFQGTAGTTAGSLRGSNVLGIL